MLDPQWLQKYLQNELQAHLYQELQTHLTNGVHPGVSHSPPHRDNLPSSLARTIARSVTEQVCQNLCQQVCQQVCQQASHPVCQQASHPVCQQIYPQVDSTSQSATEAQPRELNLIPRLERIRHRLEERDILQTAVNEVRDWLNADRVVIYRFDQQLNGQVVAEALRTIATVDTPIPAGAISGRSSAPPALTSLLHHSCGETDRPVAHEQTEPEHEPEHNHEASTVSNATSLPETVSADAGSIESGKGLGTKSEGAESEGSESVSSSRVKGAPPQMMHESQHMMAQSLRSILHDHGATAVMMTPIFWESTPWGILAACQHLGGEFPQGCMTSLEQVSRTIGQAIEQANLLEQTRAQTRKLASTLRELQQTQTQLIQNEKMASLGQLVAGIAHEINNPVNFIYGNISYIRDYTEDLLDIISLYKNQCLNVSPELQAQVQEVDLNFIRQDLPRLVMSMHNGTDRIRRIVNSLRTFSRLDESEMKTIDLHDGIDSVLLLLRHRLAATEERPDIKIIRQYHELPKVTCYAAELNQVLMNILCNSIDALAKKTDSLPTIVIQTQQTDEQYVHVSIRDNGEGIQPEYQSRIFDPFFTTKPPGKGTGLGLSVSYQIIVENHEGDLFFESTVGEGSTFTIEIPIRGSQLVWGQQ